MTAGIEKPCYITFENKTDVESAYVYTYLIDGSGAQINYRIDFKNCDKGFVYKLRITDSNNNTVYSTERYCDMKSQSGSFCIEKPALWNPLGYGKQPVYTFEVTVEDNVYKTNFGIRTVRISELPDKPGSSAYNLCREIKKSESALEYDFNENFTSFTLIVNGKKIFCKGANWVPTEPFVSEVDNKKITDILETAAAAKVNMIRVWGGGMFESDHFYSECDRLGIMVTQDFLMACGHYPEDEEWFLDLIRTEVEYAAKLIRNHPCLMWWTGDNENAVNGNNLVSSYPGRTVALKAIAPILNEYDPNRAFLPSSPYGGDRYASKTVGTTHNTQFLSYFFEFIENGNADSFKEYYKQYLARFVAEEPSLGAASYSSLRRFMTDEDIFDTDTMWYYHTKSNPALKKEILEYTITFAEKMLGKFENGRDRLFKLQYLQYEWIRVSFELFRRNMWFCSGVIYWMLSDCWPAAAGWSIIDYYGVPKASYYSFKRCASDLIGSIEKNDGKLTLSLCNDSLSEIGAETAVRKYNYKTGDCVCEYTLSEKVLPQSVKQVVLNENCNNCNDCEIVICDIKYSGMTDRCFYINNSCRIKKGGDIKVIENTDDYIVIKSDRYLHSVYLDGKYLFADNYFSMLPGETRKIEKTKSLSGGNSETEIISYVLA